MPQPDQRNERLLALHALRLKGMGDVAALATVFDQDHVTLEAELDRCLHDGLVARRDPGCSGDTWVLRPAGRTVGEQLLHEELESLSSKFAIDIGERIHSLYEAFLPLNRRLLDVCTRFQVRRRDPVELNDHSDPSYDAARIDELTEIDGEVRRICDQLEQFVSRFSRYGDGFEYALGRIRNGAVEWFAKPTIPSYHTLWFELHEDLLATLDLDRTIEAARFSGSTPTDQGIP